MEEIIKKYGYFQIDDKADLSLTLREYIYKVSPGNAQLLKELHDTFVDLENKVIEKYNLNNFHNQTD